MWLKDSKCWIYSKTLIISLSSRSQPETEFLSTRFSRNGELCNCSYSQINRHLRSWSSFCLKLRWLHCLFLQADSPNEERLEIQFKFLFMALHYKVVLFLHTVLNCITFVRIWSWRNMFWRFWLFKDLIFVLMMPCSLARWLFEVRSLLVTSVTAKHICV